MEKIYYADKTAYPDSKTAVRYILEKYFDIPNADILISEHGKPFLKNERELSLYFSISHSKTHLFIAFSNKKVGLDAERTDRNVYYQTIVQKFHEDEAKQIRSTLDFLKLWTIKESAVKYLGSTLAENLYTLNYLNDRIYQNDSLLPVILTQKEFQTHILSIVGERDFSDAEFIPID